MTDAITVESDAGLVAVGTGQVNHDIEHQYALPGEGMRLFTLTQFGTAEVSMFELVNGEQVLVEPQPSDFDAYVVANGAWAE